MAKSGSSLWLSPIRLHSAIRAFSVPIFTLTVLAIALILLGLMVEASAQSWQQGVTGTSCRAAGGRFTPTGRVGTDVGECYIPPRLPSGGGGGGGGARDFTPMIGLGIGVLDQLLNGSGGSASGNGCGDGQGKCPDGTCAPLGAQCCGGGRHCKAGNLCAEPGFCVARGAPRVCSDGSLCGPDHICIPGNRCLPTSSKRFCGGRSYCQEGMVCAEGNSCIAENSPRICRSTGQICDPNEVCKGGDCIESDSPRLCKSGSYCNVGSLCTRDEKCIDTASERVCSNGRNYCAPDHVCGSDDRCQPSAALEAANRAQRERDQAAESERLRLIREGQQRAAEQQLQAIRQKIADSRSRNANPYAVGKERFQRRDEACSSGISGLSGPEQRAQACAPRKRLPTPQPTAAVAASQCQVPEAATASKFGNWLPWNRPRPELLTPCVQIPGWTAEQPYNHSPQPVRVIVYNRGVPTVLVIPGMSASKKFGVWAGIGNVLEVKQWDGTGTEVNTRGSSGRAGCSMMNMQGWPSPECQQFRDEEWLSSAIRQIRATSRTERSCRAENGQIIMPNNAAIREERCLSEGGAVLHVENAEFDHGWPEGTKGCFFKDRVASLQWQRVVDDTLPQRQCKIVDSSDRRRVEYFGIIPDQEEQNILKSFHELVP